jgi:hypothetical protein
VEQFNTPDEERKEVDSSEGVADQIAMTEDFGISTQPNSMQL